MDNQKTVVRFLGNGRDFSFLQLKTQNLHISQIYVAVINMWQYLELLLACKLTCASWHDPGSFRGVYDRDWIHEESRFDSQHSQDTCFFFTESKPDSAFYSMATGCSFPCIKVTRVESWKATSIFCRIKNAWTYTCPPSTSS